MLISSRFTILAAAAAATLSLGLAPLAHADLSPVLEADFSGSGSGTGTGNIVQSGGTATLAQVTGATASIASGNLAGGPGGNLNIVETTTRAIGTGAALTPTAAANGFGSWWSATGSGSSGNYNTINGSFDFFYENSLASTSWGGNTSQPLNINTGSAGQFGISIQSQPNGFQFWVHNGTAGALAPGNWGTNGLVPTTGITGGPETGSAGVGSGQLMHIAGVVSTNSTTGDVTATLYVVMGNNVITPGTTPHLATMTSTSPFTTTIAPVTNFTFGLNAYANPALAQTEQFDQFRIYDGVPTTFSALPTPEPATLGLMGIGGLAILLSGKRRKAV